MATKLCHIIAILHVSIKAYLRNLVCARLRAGTPPLEYKHVYKVDTVRNCPFRCAQKSEKVDVEARDVDTDEGR